eukprot:2767859-Ditylum_brightwellii.AAC.1
MSTVWSKIAHIHRNNHHSSITSLMIPESWPQIRDIVNVVTELENHKKAKVWRLIEIPHKITHYLTTCNRLNFGQARGTPSTILPLSIEVDWATNSITSELILEGNYMNKDINALTSKLLEHCKKEQDSIDLGENFNSGAERKKEIME